MPDRLMRVVHRGADDPVQFTAPRIGQHALGCFPQQRMAEPQHGIGRGCLQDARFQRLIDMLIDRPGSDRAQQRPGRRARERDSLYGSQRPLPEPAQAAADRGSQARRDVDRRAILLTAGYGLPRHFNRRVRVARGKGDYLPQHARRP